MPTLIRFLVIIGIAAALIYGAMFALATYVTVKPRSIEQIVPPARLNK